MIYNSEWGIFNYLPHLQLGEHSNAASFRAVSIIKHTDSNLEERRKKILIQICLYVDSYQTLKPWWNYIYVRALRCNYQYLENKEQFSLCLVSMCFTFIYYIDHKRWRKSSYNMLSARQAICRHCLQSPC